ncbi:MAG: uridine monophosphate kinase [Holosporales bacterium]|nr:uridine monophosphate kinase [Holosporales bacterium]
MHKRVLLKLSGEALITDVSSIFACQDGSSEASEDSKNPAIGSYCCPEKIPNFGVANKTMLTKIVIDVKKILEKGVEVALVIGGGNICRGANTSADRTNIDKIGMIATVINGLILTEAFSAVGIKAVVLSVRSMPAVCELYTTTSAKQYLASGVVVICAGGSGQPFFSTDTAAVIRARELECDVLFKATKVDGLYDSDPQKNPAAKYIESITHSDFLRQNMGIMDLTAVSLARDGRLPIEIFSIYENDVLCRVIDNKTKKSVIAS